MKHAIHLKSVTAHSALVDEFHVIIISIKCFTGSYAGYVSIGREFRAVEGEA